MKNMITLLVIALTTLACDGVGFAQTKAAPPPTPAGPPREEETETKSANAPATVLTGEVVSVNAKAGMLTLKSKDKEIKLTTDSKSTKSALEKLKLGDTAKVFEKGGKVIAASPVKADSKNKATK